MTGPANPRLIAVANQKGGVGKTTTAVNLAVGLAELGQRVILVDLDPQGNATTGLGIDRRQCERSIYDVLIGRHHVSEVLRDVPGQPNVRLVPATLDLAGAEIELVSLLSRETRLRRSLQHLPAGVDTVLVDCPPSLGLLTVNALVAVRELLIPIQCEYYALEGLTQLLQLVKLVGGDLNPQLRVGAMLLTMFDARTRLSEQVAADVRTHFPQEVLSTVIPRSVRVSEAPGYGQSVLTFDPASPGAQAYRSAAAELAARPRPDDAPLEASLPTTARQVGER